MKTKKKMTGLMQPKAEATGLMQPEAYRQKPHCQMREANKQTGIFVFGGPAACSGFRVKKPIGNGIPDQPHNTGCRTLPGGIVSGNTRRTLSKRGW